MNKDRELVFVNIPDPYESDWYFYIYDKKWKKACDASYGVSSTIYRGASTEKLREAVRKICDRCNLEIDLSSNDSSSWAHRYETE